MPLGSKRANSGVSVGPGAITLIAMPSRACSRAIDFENAAMPPLHAAYTASPDEPTRPASEEMLTIRPARAATMRRSTARVTWSGP